MFGSFIAMLIILTVKNSVFSGEMSFAIDLISLKIFTYGVS